MYLLEIWLDYVYIVLDILYIFLEIKYVKYKYIYFRYFWDLEFYIIEKENILIGIIIIFFLKFYIDKYSVFYYILVI